MFFHQNGNTARVGVIDLKGATVIKKGSQTLVRIPGRYEIVNALVSDLNHRAITPTINAAGKNSNLPHNYALEQNYPNPFNPTTVIGFSLPGAGIVKLEIYNIMGQQVNTLTNEYMEAGVHQVTWDGADDKGNRVSSGVYFYRLEAGDFVQTKKMMLLK